VNGDGAGDLVVGAPAASPAGRSGAGAVSVIYGGPALPAAIDLASTPPGLAVLGAAPGDELGSSVASGDVNGDGIDDLILGASAADTAGRIDAGAAYVIHGGADLPAEIDLATTGAGLALLGRDAGGRLGRSVAAGDINADGIGDVIAGADHANPTSRAFAGETYVVYGGDALPATIDLAAGAPDLTVSGAVPTSLSGFSVAAGDVNGDGAGDLVIGAFGATPPGGVLAGETYVVLGGAALPAAIDLSASAPALTVRGNNVFDRSGYAVAAGDINGDGFDDVIIGAFTADPNDRNRAGETYVIYGRAQLPAIVDLDTTPAGLTVYGVDPGDASGIAVAAGDVAGGPADDLIIGAYAADAPGRSGAGEAYVVFGAAGLPAVIDLAATPAGLAVVGEGLGDALGTSLAAGDIDGDGRADLIVGAAGASPGGRVAAGRAYVIYGRGGVQVGDASCDGRVSSVDAALVLQVVAGLLTAAPCHDAADADGDGLVTAVDAALILQLIAGLLEGL
jgi:hypothetical protein